MKAKLVDKSELQKSPEERQADSLLRKLELNNAIEITPDGTSARTVRRVFSKSAINLGIDIELKTKDDKIYVLLKQSKVTGEPEYQ